MHSGTDVRDKRHWWQGRSAFTLVELLVVIGLISLLIAILLPVLAGARRSANLVKCTNNLRSIVQASFCYASANNGALPGDGFTNQLNYFIYLLPQYLGAPPVRDEEEATSSDLHLYTRLPAYRCPSFPKDWWEPPDYEVNSFEFERDERFLAETRARVTGGYVPRVSQKLGRIPRPAQLGYYVERSIAFVPRGNGLGPLIGNGDVWHPSLTTFDQNGVANAMPTMSEARDRRHFGRTPVAFFDGHVEVRHLTPGDLPLRLFDPMQWHSP